MPPRISQPCEGETISFDDQAGLPTLGVYLQVPFCSAKCTFCNFSSQVARPGLPDRYAEALVEECEHLAGIYDEAEIGRNVLGYPVDTIYLGGGTPTLLGGEQIERIIGALRGCFRFAPAVEFTLELTPGSRAGAELASLAALGVNRLSIGAQSFVERELRSIGRLHSPAATCELVRKARDLGLDNISVDLVAGLPYQTKASWLESLRTAAGLGVEHFSVYLLEIDDKSRLGRELLQGGHRYHADYVPKDDFMPWAYETAREELEKQGYRQYEISNYALSGYRSRHNLKYWQSEPYVGLGAGAHSFDGVRRWANEADPQAYIEKIAERRSPITGLGRLSLEQQIEEFFFLGLRQRDGVDLAFAAQRWGSAQLQPWEPIVAKLVRQGWLEKDQYRLRLTSKGVLVSNEIFQEFLLA